ncbi:MAG: malate dehydrogenase [Gammaproteobacteria bacterium]|nr:malate dehydrogenase [Gammaproteobacteria bacterium]
MRKISIVGAGRVGEATAHFLANRELCRELALIDIRAGAAAGCALDIQSSAQPLRFDTRLFGSDDPALLADSDLVIVTAGVPRKPGMSRSDVLDINVAVLDKIVDDVLRYAPDSKLLLVSNPVDVLTYRAWRRTGWDRSRVIGQAGVLDSARMAAFIAMETGFSVKDIQAMVLGGHGDQMVPLPRYTTISGIPVGHFIDQPRLDAIIQRTRDGGAEVLALRKNSTAYDAPAAAIALMVDAIAQNRRRIVPTVVILDGEYGLHDLAIGAPAVVGENGMESVVDLVLTEAEQSALLASANAVRADLSRLPMLG